MRTIHCTRRSLLTIIALAAACAKGDTSATSDSAAGNLAQDSMGGAAGAATPVDLSAVSGKWQVRATPESGSDTTTTSYVVTATSDTTGWTLTYPGRPPMPLHVLVAGDSITIHSGAFESVRRKGTKVETSSVVRLQGDRMVGTTTARYPTSGADSVLRLRVEGTRMP